MIDKNKIHFFEKTIIDNIKDQNFLSEVVLDESASEAVRLAAALNIESRELLKKIDKRFIDQQENH